MATNSPGSASSGAGQAGNPRKFSEKIALHKQKEAEEKAEFEKMMKELNAVKGIASQHHMHQHKQTNSSEQQGQQHLQRGLVGPDSVMISLGGTMRSHQGSPAHQQILSQSPQNHVNPHHQQHHSPIRHLSPPTFGSAVPRHGSLPNVNAAMSLQNNPVVSVLSSDDFPSNISTSASTAGGHCAGVMTTTASGKVIGGSRHMGHVSVRDSVGSAGPIRSHKARIDTSPYGSERYSSGSYHLSPPDPSWRRVHSDSAIHHSMGVGPENHHGNVGEAIPNGGALSPLQTASPTVLRRDRMVSSANRTRRQNPSPSSTHHGEASSVERNSGFLSLPKDEESNSSANKPGSLPDLSNFHVNPQAAQGNQYHQLYRQGQNQTSPMRYDYQEDQGSPYSTSPANTSPGGISGACWSPSSPRSPCDPCNVQRHSQQEQIFFPGSPIETLGHQFGQLPYQQQSLPVANWFPQRYPHWAQHQHSGMVSNSQNELVQPPVSMVIASSSSSTSTWSGSGGGLRLSDNQISEILSIPVSMLSEDTNSGTNKLQQSFCDISSTAVGRNLLHMNKGIIVDHSTNVASTNPKSVVSMAETSHLGSYRNPVSIQSPETQPHGSPSGRSTSPIDVVGSPRSPGQSRQISHQHPGVYDRLPGGQSHQGSFPNELSMEFQKFSMVEDSGGGGSLYFQDQRSSFYGQNDQPMSDLAHLLTQNTNEYKGNQFTSGNGHSVAPQTPQTPSSIPDIILTDADEHSGRSGSGGVSGSERDCGNDELALNFDSNPSDVVTCLSQEISANFADLGKLDDSMLRLLSEGVSLDQQIADPMTEEHLKL